MQLQNLAGFFLRHGTTEAVTHLLACQVVLNALRAQAESSAQNEVHQRKRPAKVQVVYQAEVQVVYQAEVQVVYQETWRSTHCSARRPVGYQE